MAGLLFTRVQHTMETLKMLESTRHIYSTVNTDTLQSVVIYIELNNKDTLANSLATQVQHVQSAKCQQV